MGKHATLNLGVRWEQQRLVGNNSSKLFNDVWSPRVGFTVDPKGDRKSKIYANFGRYAFVLPLDAAVRELSSEYDLRQLVPNPCMIQKRVPKIPVEVDRENEPEIRFRCIQHRKHQAGATLVTQFGDQRFGVPNADFMKPGGGAAFSPDLLAGHFFTYPFNSRFSLRLVF